MSRRAEFEDEGSPARRAEWITGWLEGVLLKSTTSGDTSGQERYGSASG